MQLKGKVVDLYNSAGLSKSLTELDVLNNLFSVPQAPAVAPKAGHVSMSSVNDRKTTNVSVASRLVRDSVKVENSTSRCLSTVPSSHDIPSVMQLAVGQRLTSNIPSSDENTCAPFARTVMSLPNNAVEPSAACSSRRMTSASSIRLIPLSSCSLNASSDGRFRPDIKVSGKVKQEPSSPTMRKRQKYDGGEVCTLLID